jgi:hypothetical protein
MRIVIFSLLATAKLAHGAYEETYLEGSQAPRSPDWNDWAYLKDYWFDRINKSTCPEEGDEDLTTHWDYNYQDFIASGMNMTEALNQDCTLFLRERNPRALGSRLVRHVFHDSTGGFDGFVNVHDLKENGGMFSSQKVLLDAYAEVALADGVPANQVISLADFVAWAGHAALIRAAQANVGNAETVDEGDIVPEISVRWGRLSYLNITVEDTGNLEAFPVNGPQGSGDQLAEYFELHYGLTKQEVVTLMGVHTFGGARREASGYKGMWTQSKNQFNNDYQLQLRQPLPLECSAANAAPATGESRCTYYSEAGSDISNTEDAKICLPEHEGRCEGWEQVRVPGFEGNPPKFQWRHSCKANGKGCNHLMLNIDVGMYRNIDGHLCSKEDEESHVIGTLNRRCLEGMVKNYPVSSPCSSSKSTSRVLATCFDVHSEMGPEIEAAADDMGSWIAKFAPLYDMILTHNLYRRTKDDLWVLSPPPLCEDDADWIFTRGGGGTTTCQQVSHSPSTRCSKVGDNDVPASEACPMACDTCPSQ